MKKIKPLNKNWVNQYKELLNPLRLGQSKKDKADLIENVRSDNARIIYSSSFRRMQQKAQVFSLEKNASVRSRLTHTLEVSHVGRKIAELIVGDKFDIKNNEEYQLAVAFARIVENACLLHDIGNPPFGHFGESAIQKWFKENWKEILKSNSIANKNEQQKSKFDDFFYFDGNPQGIRIAISLQEKPVDSDSEHFGFNLTFPQIMAFLKYNYSSSEFSKKGESKPGYFNSEETKIQKIRKGLNWNHNRFPLVFLMEAADDISYCLSDIEDGIEKQIISVSEFFNELAAELKEISLFGKINKIYNIDKRTSKIDFFDFKIAFTNNFINFVVSQFIEHHGKIIDGKYKEILSNNSDEGKFLDTIKNVSRRKLYRSWEAEKNELAGYKIIFGLLNSYKDILCCPYKKFERLIDFSNGDKVSFKGLNIDIELRLFNRLPEKHLSIYKYEVLQLKKKKDPDFSIKEIILRSHLVTDYISGMTDSYSLDTYRILNGLDL